MSPASAASPDALLPELAAWATATGAATGLLDDPDRRPLLTVVTADPTLASRIDGTQDRINVLADAAGADVRVATVPTGSGSGLSVPDVERYLSAGRELTDAAVDSGVRLLLVGGTATPVTTASVVGTVCRKEPVTLFHRDVSADVRSWQDEILAVRDTMFRARGYRNGPWDEGSVREILRILGTPELAVATGMLAGASVRRTPVILDGAATLAAALLAEAVSPGSARDWLAPHRPPDPAADHVMARLRLSPVIDRDLGPVSGGAGLVVLPLVKTAVALMAPTSGDGPGLP